MDELLITLDAINSKKNGFLLLETYLAEVRINKRGKYTGGRISPIDISNTIEVNNCHYDDLQCFFKNHCYQVSQNGYYISFPDLKEFIDEIGNKNILFLDNADKSMFVITKLSVHGRSFKHKYSYTIANHDINYCGNGILEVSSLEESNVQIMRITPKAVIIYNKEADEYSLIFDYHGKEIANNDKAYSFSMDSYIILRNYIYETEVYRELLNQGFVKLRKEKFIFHGTNLDVDKLSQKNISVGTDTKYNLPQITVTKRNSEWFQIDITLDLNGKLIDLASKINLFSTKLTNEVRLPNSILQAENEFIYEDGKLLLNKHHLYKLLRIIYDSSSDISEIFDYREIALDLPESIEKLAYPYQIEGIRWLKFLIQNKIGGCLADDMGLGKTFQVISILEDRDVRNVIDKILIVVPKSLISNWKKEFEKFLSSYKVTIYHGENRDISKIENNNIIISTYSTVYLDIELIKNYLFSIVVFDEIQNVKNHKSATSNAMKTINAEIKIGLSGTPMENNISELWNIMDILNPGLFPARSIFLSRYNNKKYDELKKILDVFILRRLKKDVLSQLPEKKEQIVYCDMDKAQHDLYNAISLAIKTEMMRLGSFSSAVVLKGLLLLRECCCHPELLGESSNPLKIKESCKIDTLKLLVAELVEAKHKILIFSQFTRMLDIIKKALNKYSNITFYLDGNTKNRSELVNEFETAKEGIFLISIKAGGVGLNLVSAQDVIIFDPWWNPFVEEQAIDRTYRIGQQNNVSVYKLITTNTIEERIVEMQKEKYLEFEQLINGISGDKQIDLKQIYDLL